MLLQAFSWGEGEPSRLYCQISRRFEWKSGEMKLFSLLGLKLFLLIFTILFLAIGGVLFINIQIHKSNLIQGKVDEARSTASIIKNAIHDSMLSNQTSAISNIITNIGRGEGIEGIRIYNKRGEIIYTSHREEQGHVVDTRAEACVSCHSGQVPIESPPTSRLSRIYSASDSHRVLGYISAISNEEGCSAAGCHPSPGAVKVLGVLDVRTSLGRLDDEIAASTRAILLWGAGIVVLAALASGAFIRIMVHRPVKRLIRATEQIGKGNLAYRMGSRAPDELGRLSRSFDSMSGDLQRARDEITAWSSTLEERVRQKTAELERAQERMVQVEKMASLGKLAATVAHEINNPLAGILTYTKLIIRRLTRTPEDPEKVRESIEELRIVESEARRSGNIINDLLVFARGGQGEVQARSVGEIIDRALAVLRHHLEMRGVKVERTAGEGPDRILCDPDQIQQALVALLINAAEAMPSGGTVTVRTLREGPDVRVEIGDTGCGIPPDVLPHIFEPFFTTKKEGKGLGLGLAVVYGIVKRHGGSIAVESEPGRGSLFRIALPESGPAPAPAGGPEAPAALAAAALTEEGAKGMSAAGTGREG